MSVEQINLLQLQALLPTLEFIAELMLVCVAVCFLALVVGVLVKVFDE